ncbi:MAG: ATP-binding protein [Phycisphaerae bacterium]
MKLPRGIRLPLWLDAALIGACAAVVAWLLPLWVSLPLLSTAAAVVAVTVRRRRREWHGDLRGRLADLLRRYSPDSEPDWPAETPTETVLTDLQSRIDEQIESHRMVHRSIARSNIELDQIFNAAGDAMRMIDTDYNIIQANETLAGLSYIGRNEARGRKCYEVLSCELCHTSRCPLQRVLDGQDEVVQEVNAKRRGGRDVPCILTGAAYRSYDGRVLGVVESFKDITPLKRVQQKLRLYAEKLQRNYDRMSELTDMAHRFVDLVAHEFRTPLTVVKEFAGIIRDGLGGPVTDQQAEYLGMITASADDLSQMVDDLLDSSRLKAGRLHIERRVCRAEDVVAAILPMAQSKADAKKIRLVSDIAPDLPEAFMDATKANRALVNLAINAIKFSPQEAEIVLFARASDEGDIELGVRDHGPGLSEEEVTQIFQRFRQATHGLLTTAKGFGLGLSIVKEMVALNLGSVRVDSTPGEGSTFSFVVPAARRERIAGRFIRMARDECEDEQVLTALKFTLPEHVEGDRRTSVEQFLLGTCRPMDLILPSADGKSVVAVGLTRAPDTGEGWVTRLATVAEETPDAAGDVDELDCDVLGEWPPDRFDEPEALLAEIIAHPTVRV